MDNSEDKRERTVYVSGINPQVTEELLYDVFTQVGPVEKMILHENNDGSPHHALVIYKDPHSVMKALALLSKTKLFDDRPLTMRPLRESSHATVLAQALTVSQEQRRHAASAHHQQEQQIQQMMGQRLNTPPTPPPTPIPNSSLNSLAQLNRTAISGNGLYSGATYQTTPPRALVNLQTNQSAQNWRSLGAGGDWVSPVGNAMAPGSPGYVSPMSPSYNLPTTPPTMKIGSPIGGWGYGNISSAFGPFGDARAPGGGMGGAAGSSASALSARQPMRDHTNGVAANRPDNAHNGAMLDALHQSTQHQIDYKEFSRQCALSNAAGSSGSHVAQLGQKWGLASYANHDQPSSTWDAYYRKN